MQETDAADFISTVLDEQLKRQGVGIISASDSYVLLFKTETLEGLLKAARSNPDGKVLVQIKHQPTA